MPYGMVFCAYVGGFVGFFVAATVASIDGWWGLTLWPAITFLSAVVGLVCDMVSTRTGS